LPKVNKTKYAILGILNTQPSSGYDIKKYFDQSIAYFWNENYGHIYPVLKKLEKEKLVSKTVNSEGKLSKNIYSITEAGKREFKVWLSEPAEYQPIRNEFLLKLVFSKDIPANEMIKKIEEERTKALKILSEIKGIEKKISTDSRFKKSRTLQSWLLSARYYVLQIESRIKWCDESIGILKQN
jgi:PadR family transcriptional regulator, regulatory protein AphA